MSTGHDSRDDRAIGRSAQGLFSWHLACCGLLLVGCASARPSGQSLLSSPSASLASIPCIPGALTGRVVNDSTGESLVGARILVLGTKRGADTDIDGMFRIDSIARGRIVLRTMRIGFKPRSDTIQVDPRSGLRLELRLRPVWIELREVCACDPVYIDLRIRVLDASTGRRILNSAVTVTSNATGRISRGDMMRDSQWTDRVSLPADGKDYRLVITAPGYRSWELSSVVANGGAREIVALLQPR